MQLLVETLLLAAGGAVVGVTLFVDGAVAPAPGSIADIPLISVAD